MVSLDAHNEFREKLGVKDTELWRKAMPEGAPIPFNEWWNKVFRTRAVANWKSLLVNCSGGILDDSSV
eukprot:2525877-Karenia_brevis.AAC.1